MDEIYDRVVKKFECNHVDRELRRMTKTDGQFCFYYQCIQCGDSGNQIAKSKINTSIEIPHYDKFVKEEYAKKRSDYHSFLLKNEKEKEETAWWEWYDRYLLTPEWRKRRVKVLKRAGGLCEACLEKEAKQIHHKTYRNVGKEPLFDLVAICIECHEELHYEVKK